MANDLPTDFDLIVIGTGVVESIVSAAASRIGKKVLQLDDNNYYGNHWASFNLEDIQHLEDEKKLAQINPSEGLVKNGEKVLYLGNNLRKLSSFKYEWHLPEEKPKVEQQINEEKIEIKAENECESKEIPGEICKVAEEQDSDKALTREDIKKNYRKFIIDLSPKLHFARGEFVELLITSNIARYAEFRSVSRILTWINGSLEIVPCSRSDVFANNKVSVVEKRMLMKLLEVIQNYEDVPDSQNTTLKEFLSNRKLSDNIIHFVLYALSMSNDETSLKEGIENTKKFLNSLGRFGKTPFLFSMYGSGEITQAFCRLSAVFGGIFALNQPLSSIIVSEKFEGLICGSQRISASHLVMNAGLAPNIFVKQESKIECIHRAVLITDKSLMPSEKEHLTLLLYPKNNHVILELGYLTGTCPKDLYLVHLISKGNSVNIEDQFSECIKELFSYDENSAKPRILWSSYFAIPNTNSLSFINVPSNIYLAPGPDMDIDYDSSVRKAKEIFNSIYLNEEFLPRAPDADEIVIGEDTENTSTQNEDEKGENSPLESTIENVSSEIRNANDSYKSRNENIE